jgi:hypothetical protein
MSAVELTNLDIVWAESTGTPLTVFETTDPESQTGSYVTQLGERVPDDEWTSHEDGKISVIL